MCVNWEGRCKEAAKEYTSHKKIQFLGENFTNYRCCPRNKKTTLSWMKSLYRITFLILAQQGNFQEVARQFQRPIHPAEAINRRAAFDEVCFYFGDKLFSKILTIVMWRVSFPELGAWRSSSLLKQGGREPSRGKETTQQATRRTTQMETSSGQGVSDVDLHFYSLISLLC